jgi:methanogenic corrinoid protein MtbC1
MRRAGIDVKFKAAATEMDILHAVSMTNVQIAGLSLSREAMIPRLESLISSIRKKSRNSDIRIMVGGRVFLDNPDLVRSVGADLKAVDGRDAVTQAKKVMLQLMPEMAIG